MNFVKSYDLFFFFETFVEKTSINYYTNLFKNFNLTWFPATRRSKFGRASGGIFGIVSHAAEKTFSFVNINGKIVVSYKKCNFEMLIIPVYLNPSKWQDEFNSNFLSSLSATNLMLVGDFNVRIGNSQFLPERLFLDNIYCKRVRHSKDSILNGNGTKLLELCDDLGLIILNGRFAGDEEGEFTFIGGMGCSVNDLCCTSFSCLTLISDSKCSGRLFRIICLSVFH